MRSDAVPSVMRRFGATFWIAVVLVQVVACRTERAPTHALYVPLAQLEATYGTLITGGNHPTNDQNGTGDRLGLFRETGGTIWGVPLRTAEDGSVLGCAPSGLHDAAVTDTYPAASTVIGTANEPTGWRGGTGKLELLLRAPGGEIRWKAVGGGQVAGSVCWAQELPGPAQPLQYYRLAPR